MDFSCGYKVMLYNQRKLRTVLRQVAYVEIKYAFWIRFIAYFSYIKVKILRDGIVNSTQNFHTISWFLQNIMRFVKKCSIFGWNSLFRGRIHIVLPQMVDIYDHFLPVGYNTVTNYVISLYSFRRAYCNRHKLWSWRWPPRAPINRVNELHVCSEKAYSL